MRSTRFDADNLMLRIPRNHPRFILATRNEAIAVPLAMAAGVRTPVLAVYDGTLSILPVPYSLYERLPGTNLEHALRDPAEASTCGAHSAMTSRASTQASRAMALPPAPNPMR